MLELRFTMGKESSSKTPRPHTRNNSSSWKHDTFPGVDPWLGRRLSGADFGLGSKVVLIQGLKNECGKCNSCKGGKKNSWLQRHWRSVSIMIVVMIFLVLLDSALVSVFDALVPRHIQNLNHSNELKPKAADFLVEEERLPVQMYGRLLNLASTALAEKQLSKESLKFWDESLPKASTWKPCADQVTSIGSDRKTLEETNGYIMVSANGGLNQQRVAICNAVAVSSLLNATLVLPRFLYSNVWKDPSQFGDIYQEEYFIDYLKDEVRIVKELPDYLKSLDIEKVGSLITDADLIKEAKPADYRKTVLPILKRNGIVHFLGFGNRLGFDPLPSHIQRLRCKCNFHSLKFVPKIQRLGSVLVQRIRRHAYSRGPLDEVLLDGFMAGNSSDVLSVGGFRYLALHLRFEIDMVAYSLCEFGGGEDERRELQSYREEHFPLLLQRLKNTRRVSATELRKLGRCPLTPEEAALVLAGLGFESGTYIYLAGSEIYGGESRMRPLTKLYPNLVTKENLLSPDELAPFNNFSSQLAALDFIACATSDVFAMTDSGSQLSSLVSGFRTYYGGGQARLVRPNKKRLAALLSRDAFINWSSFEYKVRKMIGEGQRAQRRRLGRSIYRQPRCGECMCRSRDGSKGD